MSTEEFKKVEVQKELNTEMLVSKLMESFDDLDSCIGMTKEVLSSKSGVPQDVFSRIEQYSDIVIKQRELTEVLKDHIQSENWSEVSRHVKIINGLSTMIRDDAQSILSGARTMSEKVKNEFLA